MWLKSILWLIMIISFMIHFYIGCVGAILFFIGYPVAKKVLFSSQKSLTSLIIVLTIMVPIILLCGLITSYLLFAGMISGSTKGFNAGLVLGIITLCMVVGLIYFITANLKEWYSLFSL